MKHIIKQAPDVNDRLFIFIAKKINNISSEQYIKKPSSWIPDISFKHTLYSLFLRGLLMANYWPYCNKCECYHGYMSKGMIVNPDNIECPICQDRGDQTQSMFFYRKKDISFMQITKYNVGVDLGWKR